MIQIKCLCRVLFSILLVMSCIALYSQTSWSGLVNSNWTIDGNWSEGVPDVYDDVVILESSNSPIISNNEIIEIKSLTVKNNAQIKIYDAAKLLINGSENNGILNEGLIENYGRMDIGLNSSITLNGILNDGLLVNRIGGVINISDVNADGILNRNGTFQNEDKVIIGLNGKVGINGIKNLSCFENIMGSEIHIDNTGDDAIYNDIWWYHNFGLFKNNGKIIIGFIQTVHKNGINNRATFFNLDEGNIQIDNVLGDGIQNELGLYNNTGNFTNTSIITIGANSIFGGLGINNQAYFNLAGGDIYIRGDSSFGVFNQEITFSKPTDFHINFD